MTEFAKLHKELQPPPEEGWSSIPWKTSLVQACVEVAREKKPLFMVSCRAVVILGHERDRDSRDACLTGAPRQTVS